MILLEPEMKTTITLNDNILFIVKKCHWIYIDNIIDPYTVFESYNMLSLLRVRHANINVSWDSLQRCI
jgi:hypothetical protein